MILSALIMASVLIPREGQGESGDRRKSAMMLIAGLVSILVYIDRASHVKRRAF
jgi:branched-subunit amino acid transport protein